jgi:23S rRNA (cytosine1962-C5)-methyltransferase
MTKPQKPHPSSPYKAAKAVPPSQPKPPALKNDHAKITGAKRQRPPIAGGKLQLLESSTDQRELRPSATGARINRRASDRLRAGHLWVYATDIESIDGDDNTPPPLIPVADNRGILMGTALYSPNSQIALRLVSREAIDQAQWLAVLATRMRTAIGRRMPLLDKSNNACRLVFSEADDLPGVIVDKYDGLVILQLLNKGLDNSETRAACIDVLVETLGADAEGLTIWERPDPRIRELEGLSAPAPTPLFKSADRVAIASTVFHLNGLGFHFDVNSGQKTGAFLDQRQNYLAVAQWARAKGAKRALDVCTYQGGFALHLAQVCDKVTGIDASRASLEVAERNLALNREAGKISAVVDWVEADAFEILRAWSANASSSSRQQGQRAEDLWDLIVLDPPAFAKSKRAVEGALRGYKELNLRALQLLIPGGLLITCSCSHHVTWSDLESAVASAAVDAHRRVTLLERRGAAQDHPVLLNLPETEYLKCLICQVD